MYDRTEIRKGMFLVGEQIAPPGYFQRARATEARTELKRLDAERQALAAKLTALRQQIDSITSKGRR